MPGALCDDEACELERGEEQLRVCLGVGDDSVSLCENGLGRVEEERGRGLEREVGEVEAGGADLGRVGRCDESGEPELPPVEQWPVEALLKFNSLEGAVG